MPQQLLESSTDAKVLRYREPGHGRAEPVLEPLLLCVPPLVWLAMSVVFFTVGIPERWQPVIVPLVWVPTPLCCVQALRRYRHGSKSWPVLTCMAVNGVGLALAGTPVFFLWAWALLALGTR